MNLPIEKTGHRLRQIAGLVLTASALLLVTSCEEQKEDVFERRYSLVEIPGFELHDHFALLDHQDANIRYLAVANLLKMGALAKPDEDDEAGAEIKKLSAKLRALLDDPAAKVRAIAAYAPINRGGDGAEQRLLAKLDDARSAVRVEAVVSLGGEGLGQPKQLTPAATDRVAGLLDDENVLVRLHALETLALASNFQRAGAVVEKIKLALAQRESPEVLKCLETLGEIESDEAEKILVDRLEDENARAVSVAIESLASRQSPALEEWLIKVLADGRDPEPHLLANLAEVATGRSRATAISMLDHPDLGVRRQCAAILEKIGDRASFDALAAALSAAEQRSSTAGDDPEAEQEELIELLITTTRLGTALGVYKFDQEGLQTLLDSSENHGQLVALAHLTEEDYYDADDAGFVASLKGLATSKSPHTRALAYQALGKSGNPKAGEILVAGIGDPVSDVGRDALEALVDLTADTAQRGPLRSVHDQRGKFEPTSYTDDDPNLQMREQIERAVRKFEPTWASVARAETEMRKEINNAAGLLAAAYLAPRDEAMAALLDALKSGSEGAKTYALQAIGQHATKEHVGKLKEILAAETDPERKMILANIIEMHSDR